ncbi:hypothetical protein PoB_006863000 [Plakobranchus ocellatus]|uniref:Uncharacterized protein n=1 Tax=Plakobranchus ocellatus TaxID=259542 RepID=A0AAV4DDM0_9GAST|nr:hypothetical protein PoB_006863000 [Plakobranchus ocellatus]
MSTLATDITTAETIVQAAILLHNAIIILENRSTSKPKIERWAATEYQEEENGRLGLPAHYPIRIKNRLLDYFMGPGALLSLAKYLYKYVPLETE